MTEEDWFRIQVKLALTVIIFLLAIIVTGCGGQPVIVEKETEPTKPAEAMPDETRNDYKYTKKFRDGTSISRYANGWETWDTQEHFCISDDGPNGGHSMQCWEKTREPQ